MELGILCLAASIAILTSPTQSASRWSMQKDGGITWAVGKSDKPHQDHIEMSGRKVSVIVRYGADDNGALTLNRTIVWPMLRTIPNNTHASLLFNFGLGSFPAITVDNKSLGAEKPQRFHLDGLLMIQSATGSGIELTRVLFPSTTQPAIIENCALRNTSDHEVTINIGKLNEIHRTDPTKGVYGEYILEARVIGDGTFRLQPGESVRFGIIYSGRKSGEPQLQLDPAKEETARREYVKSLWSKLRFECPEPALSREFAFAKIRAAESIYETKGGLMHGPGGGSYYAAIWANDQAEYANPFFPFLGDPTGNESALNAYRLFARYMTPEYKPVPSSIIAEGTDIWNGAGDRGDAAMIAYGASRFALARGDQKIAEEMWPIVEWCLEYCRRKTNAQGVIASDHDELEGRFPAGDANLCTSALTYDALRSAAYLGESLGKPKAVIDEYKTRSETLHAAIEKHFGATVEGFDTYRYYDGNTTLRAWICIPLTMGIFDRKDDTIKALFSPRLWTDDGLATEAGKETFWDRATLYGLRGVFAAGETERALGYFRAYSQRRLLGEHVPYPVEAWPEGGQRHLSAESALYCRVVTEGLFGIRPTDLRSFELAPRLPQEWDRMALRDVQAFDHAFDVVVSRKDGKLVVDVTSGKRKIMHKAIESGKAIEVELPE